MKLDEYLTKAFTTTFKVKPYLSSLFVTVVIFILFIIGLLAFFFSIIKQLVGMLAGGQMSNSMLGFKLMGGPGIGFIVFMVILIILNIIGQAFVFKKVESEMESKKDDFFTGFGDSFLLGLKVLVVGIVFYIVIGIIGAIIFAIGLIPYVGIVLTIILYIILYIILGLYAITGAFAIYGFTAKGGIGKGIEMALTLPFKKIHLVGYSFVFMITIMAIWFILGLLCIIPSLGPILYILGIPIIAVYKMGISYCMATEE